MVPNQLSKALDRLFKMLISLKTAVFIILGLALVSAVGTIYETLYDSNYAQKNSLPFSLYVCLIGAFVYDFNMRDY